MGTSFIKQSKDYELTPEIIRSKLDKLKEPCPLLEMGYDIYTAYQQALKYRGAVDFEDLIRLAYKVLKNNRDYLEKLRRRWPVILEDEAQDSSLIQEKLLSLLCGEAGNWVRVGDPNQAIFETFTTAEPRLLREFLEREDVLPCDLKYSGRSARSIIDLANHLNQWSQKEHPVLELRGTLSEPYIHPTPPGDPQPNPPDTPGNIVIFNENLQPDKEITLVANSARKWLAEHPQGTLAILVPRNARGAEIVDQLTAFKVPFVEMLRSSKATRDAAQTLADILGFYAHPSVKKNFLNAVLAIIIVKYGKKTAEERKIEIRQLVNALDFPEQFFSVPSPNMDESSPDPENLTSNLLFEQATACLNRWQQAVLLPIDQTVMTIAMNLFTEPADLALAYKLALLLGTGVKQNPGWRLPDFCRELDEIAHNRFRLYGFAEEDVGFDPDSHKGEAIISTMHKAKGLEWDRVYLLSVNNYDFPSTQNGDSYMSEKWFVRNRLNLEAELIAQLKALARDDVVGLRLPEGQATQDARLDYAAERLRLLYVGITRARRELVITRNSGQRGDCREALPLSALRMYLEQKDAD